VDVAIVPVTVFALVAAVAAVVGKEEREGEGKEKAVDIGAAVAGPKDQELLRLAPLNH